VRRKKHCWQCDALAVPTVTIVEHVTRIEEKREFCTLVCAKKWLDALIARCLATFDQNDEVAPTNPVRTHP